MAIPTQVTFRDVDSSEWIRKMIQSEADKLARFHPRIVRCRVVVQASHRSQRQGRLYQITVNVEIPGQDIAVSPGSQEHHAHEDLRVAIHEAFAAATRRIEDAVRERRHDVKAHTLNHTET